MWGQDWSNIIGIVTPYTYQFTKNVTSEMLRQNYTASRMFHQAEGFFTSLGLDRMTPQFWDKSIINKPRDRTIECHSSAYEFHNGKDYR